MRCTYVLYIQCVCTYNVRMYKRIHDTLFMHVQVRTYVHMTTMILQCSMCQYPHGHCQPCVYLWQLMATVGARQTFTAWFRVENFGIHHLLFIIENVILVVTMLAAVNCVVNTIVIRLIVLIAVIFLVEIALRFEKRESIHIVSIILWGNSEIWNIPLLIRYQSKYV